jgi:hypothetical protein
MQEVKLSVQTLNMVMGYLGTKPYQEVFQIIEAVQKEVAAQQTAPVLSPTTDEHNTAS